MLGGFGVLSFFIGVEQGDNIGDIESPLLGISVISPSNFDELSSLSRSVPLSAAFLDILDFSDVDDTMHFEDIMIFEDISQWMPGEWVWVRAPLQQSTQHGLGLWSHSPQVLTF